MSGTRRPRGSRDAEAFRALAHLIRVADHVRVLTSLALAAGITDNVVPEATERAVRDAERACADLKIWPHWGGRPTHRPERFRENGHRR